MSSKFQSMCDETTSPITLYSTGDITGLDPEYSKHFREPIVELDSLQVHNQQEKLIIDESLFRIKEALTSKFPMYLLSDIKFVITYEHDSHVMPRVDNEIKKINYHINLCVKRYRVDQYDTLTLVRQVADWLEEKDLNSNNYARLFHLSILHELMHVQLTKIYMEKAILSNPDSSSDIETLNAKNKLLLENLNNIYLSKLPIDFKESDEVIFIANRETIAEHLSEIDVKLQKIYFEAIYNIGIQEIWVRMVEHINDYQIRSRDTYNKRALAYNATDIKYSIIDLYKTFILLPPQEIFDSLYNVDFSNMNQCLDYLENILLPSLSQENLDILWNIFQEEFLLK